MTLDEYIKHLERSTMIHELNAKEYHDTAARKINEIEIQSLKESERKEDELVTENRRVILWLKELQTYREIWRKVREEIKEHGKAHGLC